MGEETPPTDLSYQENVLNLASFRIVLTYVYFIILIKKCLRTSVSFVGFVKNNGADHI